MPTRTATVNRKTNETDISVTLTLDGSGITDVRTGNGMMDHLISQLARHGLLDISISADGDSAQTGWHHTIEDVAICLGRAMMEAIGEGKGIRRMGHAIVPLDESLAQVALDFSGRGFAVIDIGLTGAEIGDLPGDLVRHFLHSFAVESRCTLHAQVTAGVNPHHMAEATFKALAKSIRFAVEIDERASGSIPSTKGTIKK